MFVLFSCLDSRKITAFFSGYKFLKKQKLKKHIAASFLDLWSDRRPTIYIFWPYIVKQHIPFLFQIPAAHLSGEIDVTEASHVYSQLYMREPGIRLLYVTPEKARFVHIHYLNQRCQLVRFMRKPYGFLRFARAYGRTMQSLQIFMIFAD